MNSVSGNTPTHVGKTENPLKEPCDLQKHPHARGEDNWMILVTPTDGETPPRTWGRLKVANPAGKLVGNTPTHVGKTCHRGRIRAGVRKHPHARGEDRLSMAVSVAVRETPPRTWGRLDYNEGEYIDSRNTPTHVGKTLGIY